MKSFIKLLFFDKKLVNTIKEAHVERERLYNLLFTGRITLKEYLRAGI
jgi:hypothetical protein